MSATRAGWVAEGLICPAHRRPGRSRAVLPGGVQLVRPVGRSSWTPPGRTAPHGAGRRQTGQIRGWWMRWRDGDARSTNDPPRQIAGHHGHQRTPGKSSHDNRKRPVSWKDAGCRWWPGAGSNRRPSDFRHLQLGLTRPLSPLARRDGIGTSAPDTAMPQAGRLAPTYGRRGHGAGEPGERGSPRPWQDLCPGCRCRVALAATARPRSSGKTPFPRDPG